MYICLADCLSA